MWILKHHPVHAFDMSTIIVFVYLWLQTKWNQFGSNNSHQTSCIHKGLHAGKWPDLMISKPDSASTLGYHWTDHTGRPLEPQVDWDATGTTLADASTQWCPSVDTGLICIMGTPGRPLEPQVHWDATGTTLADASTQWCPSGDPVLICIIETHWNTTGRPLEYPWNTLEMHWLTNNSFSSGIPVYTRI